MNIHENFFIFPALIGGLFIGLSAAILYLFNGKIMGISGITSGVLRPQKNEFGWKLSFVVGLLLTSFVLSSFLQINLQEQLSFSYKKAIIAGLLVGAGAAIANGCTSGHGVCGTSRGSKRSITATILFISSGMITVFLGSLL